MCIRDSLRAAFRFDTGGQGELLMEPELSYGGYVFHPLEDENLPKTICRDVPGEFRVSQLLKKYFKYRDTEGIKLLIKEDEDVYKRQLLYQGIIAYELWNPQVQVDDETICMARRLIEEQLAGARSKRNLILIGFMGAGKTSVGQAYARQYGLPIIDTDQRIEEAAGMAIADIFAAQGEDAFRKLETGVLNQLLAHTDHAIISVGGGLPLREENRALLKQLGCVVYLDVSPETVMERIGGDVSDRPMLQSEDVEGRIRELLSFRRPVSVSYTHLSLWAQALHPMRKSWMLPRKCWHPKAMSWKSWNTRIMYSPTTPWIQATWMQTISSISHTWIPSMHRTEPS